MSVTSGAAPVEAEQFFRIPLPGCGSRLFLRSMNARGARRGVVLYLHGATFPSALSIAYRFHGRSWRDALTEAGMEVWGLDFLGFGESDRYPQMDQAADRHAPLGVAADASEQVAAAVKFILAERNAHSISLITHSWGSMPAALFATAHPTHVDRIFMFAPLARREGPRYVPRPMLPAWKLVTNEEQWARFVEDVPADEAPVLSREIFSAWAQRYLDSDPQARKRATPAVKVPTGPLVEILRAWHGELAWDPAKVEVSVAIARGAWDGLVTDADARWLFDSLSRARDKRDIKIARGTHLMHLEENRAQLWQESIAFLLGGAGCAPNDPYTHHGNSKMQDHHGSNDLPGYNPGASEVAKSPVTLQELQELKASCLFTDEDMVYLRLSYDVLKEQAEDLVIMWRGIIAQHTHLAQYSWDQETGQPDKTYGVAVGKRFAQWVLDTARAEYDQAWLDYQYEIGLRHHRKKKNQTDHVNTAAHIRGRDLIGFAAATVAPMRPYLEKGGHSPDVVQRMQTAWWKSMILQVTLWSQPYMNPGDF